MNEYDPNSGEPIQIGQYEVTGRIGRGSFGVVYRGRDPYLKRDVAIKVCTVDDEHLRQRFYREAEIAGKLEHDYVVAVHAFGFEDEAPYLVQEFLEGEDLSHLIGQRVAWSGRRKLDILAQIAEALAYAHDQGVIHRDVKPANVRVLAVDPEVRVKLMDFGIAKLAHDESQLTQKGVTMGTASYLPPEQVKGGDVDHRGDIFSFGVLAYELFTLERPFRGQTLSALVYQILYKQPVKLEEAWPACPPELSAWVHRCLQKDPAARFGTFRELLDELEPIREGVAAGRRPELDEVWLPGNPPAVKVEEAPAEEALEASVGSATRVIRAGSHDLDATQPVAAKPTESSSKSLAKASAETPPPLPSSVAAASDSSEAVDAAATRLVPMPTIPSKPGETQDEIPEELRTSAHEISKLVEARDFDAAMHMLEQTIHRQKNIASADGVTGVLPLPPSTSGSSGAGGTKAVVQIDAERPTVEIPRATTEAARAAQPASTMQPPVVAPPPLPPGIPSQGATLLPDPQLSRPDGTATAVSTPGSTAGLPRRTGGKGKWILVGAFAVAAVLAVVMGWWLGNERSDKTPIPQTGGPPAPETPDEPPATGLVVQATPWAYVAEVTNADGYTMELPEGAATPLYLPLEPGEYTVIVQFPAGNAEQRCVVEVTAESSALCVTPFTQPTASDYFKDAGWWR